jgi:hypothetical protein
MTSNKASRLDTFLTCFAGVALLSAFIAVASGPLIRARASAQADYRVGDSFAKVAGLDFSRSAATIVVFISTTCGACQKSVDSFRQLAEERRHFQLAVIGYEDAEPLRRFVDESEIRADFVLSVPSDSIRLSGVPKLVVLDRRGVVRSIWSGSKQIPTSVTDILASVEDVAKDDAVGRPGVTRGR